MIRAEGDLAVACYCGDELPTWQQLAAWNPMMQDVVCPDCGGELTQVLGGGREARYAVCDGDFSGDDPGCQRKLTEAEYVALGIEGIRKKLRHIEQRMRNWEAAYK